MEQPIENSLDNTLEAILGNNRAFNLNNIARLLIVYDDADFILGDNCIILYNLGLFKQFFGDHITMDLNIVTRKHEESYRGLCKNNPNFEQVRFESMHEVQFDQYGLIICISTREEKMLKTLHLTYTEQGIEMPPCAIFSLTNLVFQRRRGCKEPVFPIFEEILDYALFKNDKPYELYFSAEEQQWGNEWLEENGMKKVEDLYVIVDNASHRSKVLNLDTYYDVLIHLLQKENARILILDHENMDKASFYQRWLGDELFSKIIVAKGLTLRQNLCLISSRYTKMVFGPCTGVLHCAAAIYTHFQRNGLAASKVPLIITYTGPWDAKFWWGNSLLANCLLLRNVNGKKEMAVLKELSESEQQNIEDRLNCSEYTSEMLTGYIERKWNDRQQNDQQRML